MGKLDKLYGSLPTWAQHVAVSAFGIHWKHLRFGGHFRQHVDGYIRRERNSPVELQQWVEQRLLQVLAIAVNHTPFYRNHWSPSEKQAAAAGRLSDLPLLEKSDLRNGPRDFLRQDKRCRREQVYHTSGSTGTPIQAIWTPDEYRNALALREVRSARWAGVSFSLPRATFSGRIVEPNPDSTGPFYRFNFAERQVYFSAFHLRRETASKYVEALRRHRIQWLTGYAVSYYLLAQFCEELQIDVPRMKAVIPTSEKVTPQMRTVMERVYGCKVYEEYSTVENAVFASECEQGRLHVSTDAGIVEILRPDGTPCDAEEEGEVVATCLMRDYQPMIRFRLGDVAAWSAESCPCSRPFPVLKEVVGRIEDVVVGPDGRQMVRFHGIFTDQPHVIEGQIIQEAIDRIRCLVVPIGNFNERDRLDIIHRIQQRLGPRVSVEVQCVESIPRTKAGKFKAVISCIGKDDTPTPSVPA
jgi:phenylacetate-CoA ligase